MTPGLAFALGTLAGAVALSLLERMDATRGPWDATPWHLAFGLVVVVALAIGSAVAQ